MFRYDLLSSSNDNLGLVSELPNHYWVRLIVIGIVSYRYSLFPLPHFLSNFQDPNIGEVFYCWFSLIL